jgi:Holliday junction resolvase RusA-like endonuclease
MATPLRLTLPLPPIANHLYAVVRGHKVKSKAAREYQATVQQIVRDLYLGEGDLPLPPYALEVHLYLKHDRDVGGEKALQDSLATALGFNDKVIKRLVVEKFEDKRNPRCEIALSEIEGAARQPRLGMEVPA